jgi:hypothetical protein
LRYARHFFHTPVPPPVLDMTKAIKPGYLTTRIIDFCFLRAFLPNHPSCRLRGNSIARFILYVRSHYLRMPMYLLIPHLTRKAWMQYFHDSKPEREKVEKLMEQN